MEAEKTPLYEVHCASGGRMVDFAGWTLPVQYEGIVAEHIAVRCAAGLFDVSHMGEVAVRGGGALAYINRLLTNEFSTMDVGGVRYSPMCYENGGTVDDVLVYKKADDDYLIVVNASNREKDMAWMRRWAAPGVQVEDVSDSWAQIALQGPKSPEILSGLLTDLPQRSYTFLQTKLFGEDVIISRTGYTGEDGFEIYCPPSAAPALWAALMGQGRAYGLVPCGLGARDTLRLEAAMPLYGHELSAEISPLQAALSRFVKLDHDFIGRAALQAQKDEGVTLRRCGIILTGRGIAREGAAVYVGDERVGIVSSGTKAPFLDICIAMAYVEPAFIKKGTSCHVEVRGKRIDAEFCGIPFYKK